MADIPGFVVYVAGAIAEQPEAIAVSELSRGQQRVVRLNVSPQDMGRVIGRDGRVANAMRTVVRAAAVDEHWGLEIVD
jgi:predicted RNA-binding protein YlqC (UPF0109 family)